MLKDLAAMDIEAFRRARFGSVTGPTGDAALVGTFWISGPTVLDRFPGAWDLSPERSGALRYTAPGDGSVTADDAVLRGSLDVAPAGQGSEAVLRHGASLRATVLDWPGIGLAVRLWDASDPSVASLAAIASYPYDPAWRLDGLYTSLNRAIDYEYHGHGGRREGRHVVGEVAIVVHGRAYRMLVTRNASGLTTVFGDATNGHDTYGGGRFVSVSEPDGGRSIVDFNRSTLPPCAFSPHFDCPLPPQQNVIQGPVSAGEKSIVRR